MKETFFTTRPFLVTFFLILMKFNSLLGNGKAAHTAVLFILQNCNTLSQIHKEIIVKANDEEV